MHLVRSLSFHYFKKRQKLVADADLFESCFFMWPRIWQVGSIGLFSVHASILKGLVACCHSYLFI
jgi:hypothetical protein